MHVNWTGLAVVFGVSFGAVIAMVALFALGVGGTSMRMSARAEGGGGRAGTVTAAACFTACAAIVAFGVYLIVGG